MAKNEDLLWHLSTIRFFRHYHIIQHRNKKAATIKIVGTFQDQIKKNGSDARIKMYGDVPVAAGWWSWLLT